MNRIVKKIMLFVFIIILCSPVIPVKTALHSTDSIADKSYFVVRQISSGSTEAGLWLCNGDAFGIYADNAYVVELQGNIPQDILSSDVYQNGETMFVVYGTTDDAGMTADNVNVINCKKWDFIGDISRASESIRLPLKKYITIYDLKFFDFVF